MENFEKLYESLKSAYFQASLELIEIKKANAVLEIEKRKWEAEKLVKDRVIHEAITKSNQKNNEYLEENKSLREEIANMKKNHSEKAPVFAQAGLSS